MFNENIINGVNPSGNKVKNSIDSVRRNNDEKDIIIRNLGILDKLRGHQFITKEILNKAEVIGNQDKSLNPEIIVKYFSPSYTFYITEINQKDLSHSFGYVYNNQYKEGELGYIDLKNVSLSRNSMGMPVERDLYFDKKNLGEIDNKFKKEFPDELINKLDKTINGDNRYSEICDFFFCKWTNTFEVFGKPENKDEDSEHLILSSNCLSDSDKEGSIEEQKDIFMKKLDKEL